MAKMKRFEAHTVMDDEKFQELVGTVNRREIKFHMASKTENKLVDKEKLVDEEKKLQDLVCTVNRQVLCFDLDKVCSVSMSKDNVYACLVCGKFYQGRGHKSHAFHHSIKEQHSVFINLNTKRVYHLPDGDELLHPALEDVKLVLDPRFTREQVADLDSNRKLPFALDGSKFVPGMVGLLNMKGTDFVNVTIQSLMHVTPIRDFFLVPENYMNCKSDLVQRFGELTRKVWNAGNFKGEVFPYEFLQSVANASKERFHIGKKCDPAEFLLWLLESLHIELQKSDEGGRIIHKTFKGELEVQKYDLRSDEEPEIKNKHFLVLSLDFLPDSMVTKCSNLECVECYKLEQTPVRIIELLKPTDKWGELTLSLFDKCPPYLILHINRFSKNTRNVMDKNTTYVYSPLEGLYLPRINQSLYPMYDLLAKIVHDGEYSDGSFRAYVRKSEKLWYEIKDHRVIKVRSSTCCKVQACERRMPHLPEPETYNVESAESYILVYKRLEQSYM